MATTGLADVIYAGNKRTLAFAVKDSAGAVFDLTGYAVRFAVSEISEDQVVSETAVFEKSDTDPTEIEITDAVNGAVSVYLVGADTASLFGNYHFELEIVDDADSESIVVAEGTMIVRRNISNT